jgi:hypothetical protein
VKSWERISITLILCLTLLAAVWLHGILNRYEVFDSDGIATRYDRITGRVWLMAKEKQIELGVSQK